MLHEKLKDWQVTEVDKRILALLAEGNTAKEISQETFKSVQNINWRINRMRMIFSARNTTHLIAKYLSNNIVPV